jgi:hypothetical protein
MNFLVVGAGIAGSSFTRMAREAGHTVTVIANEAPCSSRAALCVVKPSWFKDEYRDEAEWSLGWYRAHGWVTSEEAEYSGHLRPNREMRKGYFAIHPTAPLVQPDVNATWPHFDVSPYDHVVLCRGASSDLNWKRLWGATSVYVGPTRQIARAYNDRPRSVIFTCSHDGTELRFGSSRAKSVHEALEKQREDERKATQVGFLPDEEPHRWDTGVRLMPPRLQDAGLIRSLDAKTSAVEGFGRVGYSLAPARMNELFLRLTA